MAGEAIDVFESQSGAGQNAGDRRCDVLLREWGDRAVEDDAEEEFRAVLGSRPGPTRSPDVIRYSPATAAPS